MYNIIKRFIREDAYFYALLVVLVAASSFALGRLSVIDANTSQSAGVVRSDGPDEAHFEAIAVESVSSSEAVLVGSKNGTKYHARWCPGASQIHEENKVFFNSEAEANAKGYTAAGNCEF